LLEPVSQPSLIPWNNTTSSTCWKKNCYDGNILFRVCFIL